MPKVTICEAHKPVEYCYTTVIPTKDRPDLLGRALRSVEAQQLPARQVIVIDDGSLTANDDIVRSFCARAELIRLSSSVGASAARNIGIQKARCPVVMFLDDDDEWRPSKTLVQCRYLAENPSLVGASCHIDEVRGRSVRKFRYSEKLAYRWLDYANLFGSFSAFAVRRDIAVRKTIDEKLPALQDWDFYRRLGSEGVLGLVEEPLVVTHAHKGKRITTDARARANAYSVLLSKASTVTWAKGSLQWVAAENYWAHSLVTASPSESVMALLQGIGCATKSDYHPLLRTRATVRAVVNVLTRLCGGFPVRG